MFERIRLLIQHLHEVSEVNALSDRDLDDLGMTRGQMLDFLNMPHDITQRVTAMGKIFGLSQAELTRDHTQWVDLLSVCGHCSDRGACGRLLAKGRDATPDQAPFCGNHATFDAMAVTAA